ncbi:MAG TPA: hypothetical protein VGX23_33740 [Actinocrinis sp.]|nr:hypothetical protein [Actinocrinis sp.]
MNDDDTPGTGDNHDGEQARDGNGRWARSLSGAEKDAHAVRLRSRGMTLDQIAAELGYSHASAAHKAIGRALAMVPAQDVNELRIIQNAQLDMLTARTVEILDRAHPVISQAGKVVVDENGQPVRDPGPVLAAAAVLLRILERRAKLNGMDEPDKHDFTLDSLDRRIAELSAELGRPVPRVWESPQPREIEPGPGHGEWDVSGGEE